jgi:hypothetical protein
MSTVEQYEPRLAIGDGIGIRSHHDPVATPVAALPAMLRPFLRRNSTRRSNCGW